MNTSSEAEIIPEIFMDMMLERNALSHTYDFERFNQAVVNIKERYLAELEKAYRFFMNKEITDNA